MFKTHPQWTTSSRPLSRYARCCFSGKQHAGSDLGSRCCSARYATRLLTPVTVHRVRPWTPEDGVAMGDALLRQLYGEFLPDGASEPVAVRVITQGRPSCQVRIA